MEYYMNDKKKKLITSDINYNKKVIKIKLSHLPNKFLLR